MTRRPASWRCDRTLVRLQVLQPGFPLASIPKTLIVVLRASAILTDQQHRGTNAEAVCWEVPVMGGRACPPSGCHRDPRVEGPYAKPQALRIYGARTGIARMPHNRRTHRCAIAGI